MWAADEGHAAAVKLLIERGADIKAKSNPAPRGRGPALGKANDPRKAGGGAGRGAGARRPSGLGAESLANGAMRWRRAATPDAADGSGGRGGRCAAGGGRGGGRRGDAVRRRRRSATTMRAAAWIRRRRAAPNDGGGLTPLVFAARANDLESVKVLLAAGADVNQTTGYGWSPLLVATQNRYYKLAAYLLERGADVEPREQRRLDAAVSRDGQPQHRERRLSGPQAGHGPPGVHQAPDRQGRRRQSPRQGQHRDADGVHEPVARRERRDGVPARVAVRRRRADEAAALARRRSEDQHRSRT